MALRLLHLLPANRWKILAILFALLNLKSLPFAWHVRLLRGLYLHVRSSRLRLRTHPGPSTLFQPMITSTRASPLECDYNFHKSNSTYLSDLDVGRLHLLVSLMGHGIDITRQELAKEMPQEKGGFYMALGGVACNFRREIKPFEAFEIWTRVLAWDHKWVFVIGHFVKPGTVKPGRYIYQPWKKKTTMTTSTKRDDKAGAERMVDCNNGGKAGGPHPAILASAIAKYVFKKGRLTIPPERVLRASQLLPPKPADLETPPISETPVMDGSSIGGASIAAASAAEKLTPDNAGDILASALTPNVDASVWDWQRVEDERVKGMRIAELHKGLDALNELFAGEDAAVLGRY
ncbi:MAG: hypothetical protein Q9163_006331 [Psora crenata]